MGLGLVSIHGTKCLYTPLAMHTARVEDRERARVG